MDVILDLHWSESRRPQRDQALRPRPSRDQQPAANGRRELDPILDRGSPRVSGRRPRPGSSSTTSRTGVSWGLWLDGGTFSGYPGRWHASTIRRRARQPAQTTSSIAGGLSYAFDLSGVGGNPIKGYKRRLRDAPLQTARPAVALGKARSGTWQRVTSRRSSLLSSETRPPTAPAHRGGGGPAIDSVRDARQISWTAWAWWAADWPLPGVDLGIGITPRLCR